MVLVGIIGELGAGKTLALTYIGFKKMREGRIVYSNYHLKSPYFKKYNFVESAKQIEDMNKGIALMDEFWIWLDSRESTKQRNKIISGILLKSRKRDIDILYTSQSIMQMDVRVRRVTDFIIKPVLTHNEKVCTLYYFRAYNFYMGLTHPEHVARFYAPYVWKMYDTREEIQALDE